MKPSLLTVAIITLYLLIGDYMAFYRIVGLVI